MWVTALFALLQETWSGTEARLRAFRAYNREKSERQAEKRAYEAALDQLRAELRAAKRDSVTETAWRAAAAGMREANDRNGFPGNNAVKGLREHLKRQDEPS